MIRYKIKKLDLDYQRFFGEPVPAAAGAATSDKIVG